MSLSSEPEPEPVDFTAVGSLVLEVDVGNLMYFEFEKLDVYRVTMDFVAAADEVAEKLPKGRQYLKDQLRRGANSIAAKLAEGVGEYSPAEKIRFYRISRRSAVECASHLHTCRRLALVDDPLIAKGLDQLLRIIAKETSMIRSISGKTDDTRKRSRARARARKKKRTTAERQHLSDRLAFFDRRRLQPLPVSNNKALTTRNARIALPLSASGKL